jgi:hypothetical protein
MKITVLLLVVLAAALTCLAWVDARGPFAKGGFRGRGSENRPEGEWTLGECKLKAMNGRLTWTIPLSGGSSVHLQADYSTTKDGLVYGIITKVEYPKDVEDKLKEKLPDVDDTFSFRFRVDEGEMNIRYLKGKGFEQLKVAAGRYKSKPERFSGRDKAKDKYRDRDKDKK